jgi:two-component system, OmpR family, phosphate regulon response regulator PhoB
MKKVLIIDDEKNIVEMLGFRLENAGYGVSAAHTGEEGVVKATADLPDLILLDLMMPGLTGMEVAKLLQEDADTKDIPIILFTAISGPKLAEVQGVIEPVACIQKPFNPEDLMRQIHQVLNGE